MTRELSNMQVVCKVSRCVT